MDHPAESPRHDPQPPGPAAADPLASTASLTAWWQAHAGLCPCAAAAALRVSAAWLRLIRASDSANDFLRDDRGEGKCAREGGGCIALSQTAAQSETGGDR